MLFVIFYNDFHWFLFKKKEKEKREYELFHMMIDLEVILCRFRP